MSIVAYTIVGGADAAKFAIVEGTGVLSFVDAPDYDNPTDANADNVYEVVIMATDNEGDSTSQARQITVTSAWPSASTTGVPSGTTLTPHGSDFTTTSDSETVEELDVDGWIIVIHDNVTVQSCQAHKIRIGADDSSVNATNCLVQDCTLVGTGGSGITGVDILAGGGGDADGAIVRRCDISGVENGFDLSAVADILIEDNYLHDLAFIGGDPHVDGIQCPGAGPDITISHNYIDGLSPVVSSCTTWSNATGVTIINNKLVGGTSIIYIEDGCSGFVVQDNLMTISPTWGYVSGSTAASQTYTDNYDENGDPLDLP